MGSMQPVLAAIALFAGACLPSIPAEAAMTLCNTSPKGASVAVGYRDADKGWVAQGWWNVAGGDCQTLVTAPLSGEYAYLLVDGGRLAPGDKQDGGWFCTDTTGFVTRNADYSTTSTN